MLELQNRDLDGHGISIPALYLETAQFHDYRLMESFSDGYDWYQIPYLNFDLIGDLLELPSGNGKP